MTSFWVFVTFLANWIITRCGPIDKICLSRSLVIPYIQYQYSPGCWFFLAPPGAQGVALSVFLCVIFKNSLLNLHAVSQQSLGKDISWTFQDSSCFYPFSPLQRAPETFIFFVFIIKFEGEVLTELKIKWSLFNFISFIRVCCVNLQGSRQVLKVMKHQIPFERKYISLFLKLNDNYEVNSSTEFWMWAADGVLAAGT